MRTRRTIPSHQDAGNDVGTLWTMKRLDSRARCALIAWRDHWELQVLIDNEVLLTERCERADDAFTVANRWRQRMLANGWQQIVPRPAPPPFSHPA